MKQLRNYMMLLVMMFSSFTLAAINYHGRIINQSTNNPLISSNVRFNFKIKAGASCIVYEENHDNIDMSGSNGYFSHNIGDGSTVFGTFDNAMKIDGTTVNCSGGGTVSLTSVIAKSVDVQILEHDGSSYATNVALIAGVQIKDVPVAIEAKSLSGKTASSFIQVSGAVSQLALDNLITGVSSPYVLSTDLSTQVGSLTSGKLNATSNLSDVSNVATARTNLGLGSLATLNSVTNAEISSLSWSKLTGVPTSFTPSAHSHAISDITNLQTQLTTLQSNIDAKVGSSQFNLNCTSAQTIQYISITDSYQCQAISISSSQVSGLGSLATLNSVGDANITSLSGSKLTGGVQLNTVAGSTCSSAGLTRYNSGTLEVCNGTNWTTLSAIANGSTPIISEWTAYTPTFTGIGTPSAVNMKWRRVGSSIEILGTFTNGTITAVAANFTLPSGLSSSLNAVTAVGQYGSQGSSGSGLPLVFNTADGKIYFGQQNWQVTNTGTALATGGFMAVQLTLPITGWAAASNNVVAYTAPVKAKYRISGTQTLIAGETILNFNSQETDSTGSLVTTGAAWRFTAPTAGFYEIKAFVHISTAQGHFINLYKNNTMYERIGQQPSTASSGCPAATGLQLNAGEYIDLRMNLTTATTNISSTAFNWISIVRVAD